MVRGGAKNIPDYCIATIEQKEEKARIIRSCDEELFEDIVRGASFPVLMNKIDAFAKFIIAYNSEVLGYVAIYTNDLEQKIAYITLIAIQTAKRRKRIGSKLLKACVDIALRYGMNAIKLEVKCDNKTAIRFYEHNGFRFCGKCSEESVYMELKLV